MKRVRTPSCLPWPLLETENANGDFIALNLQERFSHHEVDIARQAHEAPSHATAPFMELLREQVRVAASNTDPAWKRFFYTLDRLPGEG